MALNHTNFLSYSSGGKKSRMGQQSYVSSGGEKVVGQNLF